MHRVSHHAPLARRRTLAAVAGILAIVVVTGVVVFRPVGELPDVSGLGFVSEVFDAEVSEARDVPCAGPTEGARCFTLTYTLLEGPDAGQTYSEDFVGSPALESIETGDTVVLARNAGGDPQFRYRLVDRRRTSSLLWLVLLFAAAVVLLGRLRGVAALAGLAATILVLLQFVLPAVLTGRNPVVVAIIGASAVAFLALYLAHGFTTMTTVALLGTLAALAATAILATIFVGLADLTGFATEEATIVQIGASGIDLSGLLLGGVVIGALGAIDDMTVTQASAVWELREANPRMGAGELVRSGMRIGRDHVASTVNTLALAYAGASLPVLLLLILSRQSLGTVVNGEVVATEIVRTLVGSIGLVTAVPITTWLAAWTVGGGGGRVSRPVRDPDREPEPDDWP